MILAAVVSGDEELAALMATRHVYRAAEARLGNMPKPVGGRAHYLPTAWAAGLTASTALRR